MACFGPLSGVLPCFYAVFVVSDFRRPRSAIFLYTTTTAATATSEMPTYRFLVAFVDSTL